MHKLNFIVKIKKNIMRAYRAYSILNVMYELIYFLNQV